MSWRGRDEGRSRWGEDRRRSPVWEARASPERDRQRERERRDRYEHERHRERYDRPRDRDRRERREPRRHDMPNAPSPPRISSDPERQNSRSSRSGSRERDDDKHEAPDALAVTFSPGDWVCKCGSFNFKRRQICYRRQCQGKRSDGVVYGGDAAGGTVESSSGITKRLLFRRLDALTTEEKILESVKERCSKSLLDSIAGITIGREALTGASKCLAYINFNSIAESSAAYQELLSLEPRLHIDGREVVISYYNEPHKIQKQNSSNNADYSSYYAQMANFSSSSQAALSEADRVNAAAAVAQSAITAAQARQMSWTPANMPTFGQAQVAAGSIPTGDAKTIYTAPDVRTFMYDESSGYYYDPATGLYYDGKTQYFYNSQTNQYMYWEGTSSTYIAVTQSQQAEASNKTKTEAEPTAAKEPEEKNKKRDKEDKVKVAKKIAKDMERWARTLNQKKENAKSNIVMEQPLDTGASKGSADIGFSVLGAGPSIPLHVREISPPPALDDFLVKKNPELSNDSDENIIDWPKLTCLLCKRRFPSVDVLTKHKTMSELHKQNLAEFHKRNDLMPQPNGYRDRAAERRMKFGEDEPILNRKRYEMPDVPQPIMSAPPPSVVDTIGGKMLQKMGWSEGRGLGKSEQGRIAPIEAEQRPGLAGLGQKRGIYTPTPGETYRDTVKKLMIARYKEVVGQEEGNQ